MGIRKVGDHVRLINCGEIGELSMISEMCMDGILEWNYFVWFNNRVGV